MTRRAGSIQALAATWVVGLCVVYSAAGLVVRPSIMPDPSYGFAVLRSMHDGAPWNHLTEPDPQNIAAGRTAFFTVWSPGQYAVPGVFVDLGLSLGAALQVTLLLGSLIGLAGWFSLYSTLGFGGTVALVCCALIAASRGFNFSFLSYNGSELLTFASFPWIAVAVHRTRHSAGLALAAALGILLGFFAKNSMAIYVTAWIGGVLGVVMYEKGVTRATTGRAIVTLAAVAGAIGILYWGFISRGWTPLSHKEFAVQHYSYALPAAMPALAGTAWDDVFSWLFAHPSQPAPVFDYKRSRPLLGALAIGTAIWLWIAARNRQRRSAAIQASICVGLAVAVFSYLFIAGSSASLELSRHYRILGYVLLPILIAQWVESPRPAIKAAVALVLMVPCVYGVLSFGANWRRHYQQRASHSERVQVTHLQLSPRTVRLLTAIDQDLPGLTSLVVTPTPMHALEFQRARVLATSVVDETVGTIDATPKLGRVDNLIVVAEMSGMTEAEASAWLRSFRSYAAATWDYLAVDDQRLYVPSGQSVDRAWLEARLK